MIPEIKNILYATDLSENARYAFRYAVSLANRYDAGITILHVVEELSSFARSMVEEILGEKRWADRIKAKEVEVIADLKARLDKFCKEVRHEQPNCPFVIDRTVVVTGHPVDRISQYAIEMGADVIIMGSRGRGGLADVTLGSTSRRFLKRSTIPVMVIRLPKAENTS